MLEAWAKEDGCDPSKLAARAEAMLDGITAHPVLKALWAPRLRESIAWIADEMLAAMATGRKPLVAEVFGEREIDGIRLNPQETYSYHASKAGLIYLTRRMAARLIQDAINVTAIAPGAFASEMNRVARDQGDEIAKRIPSRRIGRDEDMAAAAIYLASRAGDYVVGETIAVDGGVALASFGGL